MAQAAHGSSTTAFLELTKKGERAVHEQQRARTYAVAEKRRLYAMAVEEIEKLIDFLDRLTGDPDLEPNGDEEDAPWPEASHARAYAADAPHEDAEDDGNGEPSLASPEAVTTEEGRLWDYLYDAKPRRDREGRQTHWARGNSNDLEGDAHEDDEDGHDQEHDTADDEPSNGWTASEAAGRWGTFSTLCPDAERDTSDDEPWLGAPENHPHGAGWFDGDRACDQSRFWTYGDRLDREPNGDELDADHAGGEGL